MYCSLEKSGGKVAPSHVVHLPFFLDSSYINHSGNLLKMVVLPSQQLFSL